MSVPALAVDGVVHTDGLKELEGLEAVCMRMYVCACPDT